MSLYDVEKKIGVKGGVADNILKRMRYYVIKECRRLRLKSKDIDMMEYNSLYCKAYLNITGK